MKKVFIYTVLLTSLLAVGCGRDTKTEATPESSKPAPKQVPVEIPWGMQKFPQQPQSWQGVMAKDSINVASYWLSFRLASGQFGDYYGDQEVRDSLASAHQNQHLKGLAVERYLEQEYDSLFTRLGDSLMIFTPTHQWNIVNSDSQKYVLVNRMLPNIYLLQAHYESGHAYLVMNALNGQVDYLWGRPYLAPDSSSILVASNDQRLQYSANGLQYFKLSQDGLALQWELGLENWGPAAIKWVGKDTVLIKREYLTPTESDEVYVSDIVQMVIAKNDAIL